MSMSGLQDFPVAFSANGIEIDLRELEELERRVAAKKKLNNVNLPTSNANVKSISPSKNTESLETNFSNSLSISTSEDSAQVKTSPQNLQPSLVSMLLVMMSVFSILNQIHYIPTVKS